MKPYGPGQAKGGLLSFGNETSRAPRNQIEHLHLACKKKLAFFSKVLHQKRNEHKSLSADRLNSKLEHTSILQ